MAAIEELDIIVEMIGGSEGVALDLVRAALAAGKHVVTANKALLAHHGSELPSWPRTMMSGCCSRRRWLVVFRQSRFCARDWPVMNSPAFQES